MEPWQLLIILVVALACGFGGDAIGKRKGYKRAGWWLGFLLGLIGLVIIACMSPSEEGRVQQETARLRVQQEAQRRLDAEREYRP